MTHGSSVQLYDYIATGVPHLLIPDNDYKPEQFAGTCIAHVLSEAASVYSS